MFRDPVYEVVRPPNLEHSDNMSIPSEPFGSNEVVDGLNLSNLLDLVVGHTIRPTNVEDPAQGMDIQNAEEFLLHPSLETLNLLPKPKRIDLVKEALEVHITDVNAMCRSFVQVSSVLRDNTETLVAYTDVILREAFKISGKPETVVNGLLIHMGLLKSEDKIKPTTNDITGSLLALEYAVKQEYFPKNLALYFIAFLSKPHSAMEGSSPARNSLLQTLQHL